VPPHNQVDPDIHPGVKKVFAGGYMCGAFGAVERINNHTSPQPRGDKKNKTRKRRTSAPARKTKYVRTFFFFLFFLVRFWAFLGKGSSKTREKKLSTFQKKTPGKYFFGNFFSERIF
jgi:hypothetical protein